MSGCRSHADLVGPYVLGALEADEMEEMRRHVAVCSRCAAEVRALRGVPGLLGCARADDMVAMLSPRLEDEVLDRFVRERAASGGPRRRWPRVAVSAIAVAVLVAAILLAALPNGRDTPSAHAELWSMAGGEASATAELAEVDAGTRVKLRANQLPVRGGTVYEVWCVRTDGRWIPGGSFHARADGTATAELTAGVRAGDYELIVVTRRSSGGLRGAEVMRGKLSY